MKKVIFVYFRLGQTCSENIEYFFSLQNKTWVNLFFFFLFIDFLSEVMLQTYCYEKSSTLNKPENNISIYQ